MNRLWWYLRGYVTVEISGAGPDWALNRLSELRIPFWSVEWLDAFTVRLNVFPRDLEQVSNVVEKSMCELRKAAPKGLWEETRSLRSRPLLWGFVVLGLVMVVLLQQFVCFYQVEGNESIPDAAILRGLEELGIGFGVYGPGIRSQWVEDHMLNLVDGLQWVTVNQSGCRAIVSVRERPETPEVRDRKGFCNIVASRAGILEAQSVWTGQPLKTVGDVVVEGEMLVSGVVDLEKTFLMTRAQAEIFARTWRKYQAVKPECYEEKGNATEKSTAIWLEIGKQRIKIFGNSGISTAACDKMISRKILSLPGGTQLPAAVRIETCILRQREQRQENLQWAPQRLYDAVKETALRQMTAGEILRQRQSLTADGGLIHLSVMLECREMIARTVEANWIEEDWKHD